MSLDLENYLDMIGAEDNIYNQKTYEETMAQLDKHLLEINTSQSSDEEMWITPRPRFLCYKDKHQVKFRLLHCTPEGDDIPLKFNYNIAYNLAFIIFVKKDVKTNFIDVENKWGFSEKIVEFINVDGNKIESPINGKLHYILFDDDISFSNQIDTIKAIGMYLLALGRRNALSEAAIKRGIAHDSVNIDGNKATFNWREAIKRENFVTKYDAIISPYLEKTKYIH